MICYLEKLVAEDRWSVRTGGLTVYYGIFTSLLSMHALYVRISHHNMIITSLLRVIVCTKEE